MAGVTALPAIAAGALLAACVTSIIGGAKGMLMYVIIGISAVAVVVTCLPIYVLLFVGKKRKPKSAAVVDAAQPAAAVAAAEAAPESEVEIAAADSETLEAVDEEEEEALFDDEDSVAEDSVAEDDEFSFDDFDDEKK